MVLLLRMNKAEFKKMNDLSPSIEREKVLEQQIMALQRDLSSLQERFQRQYVEINELKEDKQILRLAIRALISSVDSE
jgi:hypothetical protein